MKKACSNSIFTTIYVNGIARISVPKGAKRETRRRALNLYQPFAPLSRTAYNLWRHFPVSTAYLYQRSAETVPRLAEFDWRAWLDAAAAIIPRMAETTQRFLGRRP